MTGLEILPKGREGHASGQKFHGLELLEKWELASKHFNLTVQPLDLFLYCYLYVFYFPFYLLQWSVL